MIARVAQRVRAAIRDVFGPGWYIPRSPEGEVVIADLCDSPGTRVLLTDRRIVTGVRDALVFASGRDALSIPYTEIATASFLSHWEAFEEPWGLCVILQSGEKIWMKLNQGAAHRAFVIIETRRALATTHTTQRDSGEASDRGITSDGRANRQFDLSDIPPRNASWRQICECVYPVDLRPLIDLGMHRKAAVRVAERERATGTLPLDVQELRMTLIQVGRRYRWNLGTQNAEDEQLAFAHRVIDALWDTIGDPVP